MDIDQILTESSDDVFWKLEKGQYRILKIISKKGPLNVTDLGNLTSSKKYANGFDRWGVRDRLKGTSKLLGLVPYDYIQEIMINKKEKKYGLTLKGSIACLSLVNFDEIYIFKNYFDVINKFSDDPFAVKTFHNFIKFEVAYLLYYVHIQGLNWLKFRFLTPYIEKQRINFKDNFHLELPVDEKKLNKNERKTLQQICRLYGKWYIGTCHFMGYVEPKKVYRMWKNKLLGKQDFDIKIKNMIALHLYGRLWCELIGIHKGPMIINELISKYLNMYGFDMRDEILTMSKKELAKMSGKT